MNLRISPRALEQIEQASDWWRENRDKGPQVFRDELESVLDKIALDPMSGQRVTMTTGRSALRVLMPKSARHVDYELEEGEVRVLAIWGAVRGEEPILP